jgi:hypothetical protein
MCAAHSNDSDSTVIPESPMPDLTIVFVGKEDNQ